MLFPTFYFIPLEDMLWYTKVRHISYKSVSAHILLAPVVQYICNMLSTNCKFWHVMFSGEQNFIKQLINFDKDNMSDRVLKKIGTYCSQADFQPEIIGRVSLAAKSLCMWVRAMEVYGRIYRVVEPKRQRLNQATSQLKEKQAILTEAKAKLKEVMYSRERFELASSSFQTNWTIEMHEIFSWRLIWIQFFISDDGYEI